MPTVILSGLPKTKNSSKFVFLFRKHFMKHGVSPIFWISGMGNIPNSNLKQMYIEFNTVEEAYMGQEILNNFKYRESKKTFILTTSFGDEGSGREMGRPGRPESRRGETSWEMGEQYPVNRGDRFRSRSPISSNSSQLDMELELLRKQTMVIEEEKRLLLEKKKLELMEEYGPSASTEFNKAFGSHGPRHSSHFHSQKPKYLKEFVMPCMVIMKKMEPVIKRNLQNTDRCMVEEIIRFNLRKRLSVALENRKPLSTKKIYSVYRQLHPKSTDEEFVQMAVQSVQQSYIPEMQNMEAMDAGIANSVGESHIVKDTEDRKERNSSLDENYGKTGGEKTSTAEDDITEVLRTNKENTNAETVTEPQERKSVNTIDDVCAQEDSDPNLTVTKVQLKPNSDKLDEGFTKNDCEDWADDGESWSDDLQQTSDFAN